MNKKILLLLLIIITGILSASCNTKIGGTKSGTSIIDDKTFIDDSGNLIKIDKPYKRIISLYKENTENLFHLDAGDKLIGVDENSTYPFEVTKLPYFSLKKEFDIGRVVNLKPDLVLSSPSVNKKYPGFITKLETSGLKVISLGPDNFLEFDIYIKKLAMLTGKESIYQGKLDSFYNEIDKVSELASKSNTKIKVFFESSEQTYSTVAKDSLPYLAIDYANGDNIGKNIAPYTLNNVHGPFGLKNIIAAKDNIDVYLSLRGIEEPGTPIISINQKTNFQNIKAIQEKNVYEVHNSLIGSYTFRYSLGVKEIGRYLYPNLFDDISEFKNQDKLTKENFCKIVVKFLNTPTYVTSGRKHYEIKKYNHFYGSFNDVDWKHKSFNYIETAVMRSYISGFKNNIGEEYFHPKKLVTKSEIAKFIYMLYDIKGKNKQTLIKDINTDINKKIIQKIVDNNMLTVDNGYFNPDTTYTNLELIDLLEN